MNDIATLVKAITQDQQTARRIARVTIQPWVWQELGKAGGTFTEYSGFRPPIIPTDVVFRYNIMGVPMEIDEMQEESYRLWDADGKSIDTV